MEAHSQAWYCIEKGIVEITSFRRLDTFRTIAYGFICSHESPVALHTARLRLIAKNGINTSIGADINSVAKF